MQTDIGRIARRWRGAFFVAVCGAGAFLGEARTVALWPLEQRDDGAFDGRCLIDSTNKLSLGASGTMEASGVDWGLPPNPDAAFHMVERANESAVRSVGRSPFLFNAGGALCRHVARDRDFTIEGWLKFADLPASNDWWFIVGGYDGYNNNDQRWMLSFRAPGEGVDAFHWHVYAPTGIGNVVLYRYAQEDLETMTNGWRHLALVHEAAVGDRERWTFYLDGVQLGQCMGAVETKQPPPDGRFEIGARASSGNSRASKVLFDYWRLSDTALSPADFLCAGDAGTARPAFETVAYWPLDVTESGVLDSHDAVGDAALSGGFWTSTSEYAANRIAPCADAAFVNPPNATVALPNGNAGCVQGVVSYGTLLNNGVGTYLSLTNDFTVEGWIAPRVVRRDTTGEVPMYVFGTRRTYEKGWALQLRYLPNGTARFDLFAQDDLSSDWVESSIQANQALSGDVSGWYETWRHVALVYDHAGGEKGHGRWELFLDGASVGVLENDRAPIVKSVSPWFVMLDRIGAGNGNGFTGRMDCIRVSGTALSPAQFMCAVNGTAATDVLALWPLNVVNGAYFDLKDVVGTYHLFDGTYDVLDGNGTFTTREYCARGVLGIAPSISNPETSAAFRGDASRLRGSALFRTMDGNAGRRSSLVTGASSVMSTLLGDFTLECYFQRKTSSNKNQEVFFAISTGNQDMRMRFFYDATLGFRIWEAYRYGSTLPDTTFAGTTPDDITADAWHHLALVHTLESVAGVEKSVYRLFIDGVQKGEAAMSDKMTWEGSSNGELFLMGGRHWRGDNSLRGLMSSVRLSKGVRPPEAFLCAVPASSAETSAVTCAYWPLDMVAGTADLSCWLDADYGFTSIGMVGAAAAARPFVPRIAELGDGFGGHSRSNGGAVSLASGAALVSPARGLALEPGRTFTVEGWVKWENARAADETVFQVGRPGSSTGGIRLFIDKSGATPKLRLRACGRWPNTPYADGVLLDDAMGLAGVWTHLALVHDLMAWRLYVDGRLGGTLVNLRAPAPDADYFSLGDLTLGSSVEDETFIGAFDLWRLSLGVREPDDFLYSPPRGTVFILR